MSSTAVSFFLHRRSPPSSSPRSLFSSFFHFMSSLLSLPPRRCYSRTAEDNESPVKIPSPLQDKWILLSKLQYESWPLLSFVSLFSSSASFFFSLHLPWKDSRGRRGGKRWEGRFVSGLLSTGPYLFIARTKTFVRWMNKFQKLPGSKRPEHVLRWRHRELRLSIENARFHELAVSSDKQCF